MIERVAESAAKTGDEVVTAAVLVIGD